jgi:DNA repair photolyase
MNIRKVLWKAGRSLIISASRRTDIPAFYSEWFMERIHGGSFTRINPFWTRQQQEVSLLPETVDAIVFWSKYPGPLLPHLKCLDRLGYRYYFQFTLNNYPGFIEPGVPDLATRIDCFKRLSDQIGPDKVIWRYDPIIVSNMTGVDYHTGQFETLAEVLSPYTRRVVISFLDIYSKVKSRLAKLARERGLEICDIAEMENIIQDDNRTGEASRALACFTAKLSAIAAGNSLEIFSCAEKIDLAANLAGNTTGNQVHPGIQHGSCIDIQLINRLFNLKLKYRKDRSQRRECLCAAAVDMGVYNTCKFNCVYCYANSGNRNGEWGHIENGP